MLGGFYNFFSKLPDRMLLCMLYSALQCFSCATLKHHHPLAQFCTSIYECLLLNISDSKFFKRSGVTVYFTSQQPCFFLADRGCPNYTSPYQTLENLLRSVPKTNSNVYAVNTSEVFCTLFEPLYSDIDKMSFNELILHNSR